MVNGTLRTQCNGLNIGDRLTDNKTEEDDYRFHDAVSSRLCRDLGCSALCVV